MADPREVAVLVDAATALVDGVTQVYRAAPVGRLLGVRDEQPMAHVTVMPSRGVRVSVAVVRARPARETADAVARSVRAALPDDWSDASVLVQVRRIAVE